VEFNDLCIFRQQQMERNVQTLSQTNKNLCQDLEDSEQTRSRLELTVSELRASNRDVARKLKAEKDEVGFHWYIHYVSKNVPTYELSVTLSNFNGFSKFSHCWKACEIYYETRTTLPILP